MAHGSPAGDVWTMPEILEIVLELVFNLVDWERYWRFGLCLVGSVALVAVIFSAVASRSVCLGLSIPVVLGGIGGGIFWECVS